MLRSKCGALVLAGALGWPWASQSAEPLSLEAAISRALESNPVLRAERASTHALAQQARLDGLKPAPTLGAELENVGGTGAVAGLRLGLTGGHCRRAGRGLLPAHDLGAPGLVNTNRLAHDPEGLARRQPSRIRPA